MSISPTLYSNVSLRKFERVFTALKTEADPYAAAKQGKNPLFVFLNEGIKRLFNHDFYADQDAAADEFTAAVVDAWRALSHEGGERIFQIEDGSGKQRTVALIKKQNGSIDLVEKNVKSGPVATGVFLKPSQYYGEPLINFASIEPSFFQDIVIAKMDANDVEAATIVIESAVEDVKKQFQSASPVDDNSLALISNKKFQLQIAHEVLANANDNEPGIVAGALRHVIANGDQSDIVKAVAVLKEMLANAEVHKKEVIHQCALVLINERRIDDDLLKSMSKRLVTDVFASINEYDPVIVTAALKHVIAHGATDDPSFCKALVKSMVEHIVTNATKYDSKIVQNCALFIVRHDKLHPFPKNIALAAVNVLASVPGHLQGQTVVRMARVIIHHNHAFFSEPMKDQKNFVEFYRKAGKVDALVRYSNDLGRVLDAQKKKISVQWSGSQRHFVMGDLKHDEQLPASFYTEHRRKQPGSPRAQVLSLRSVWVQGDFEAAIQADHRLARLIVKKRNCRAIKIWNAGHEVTTPETAVRT